MSKQPSPSNANLETVRTETLPEGALFVSPGGVLYQVVMARAAGFRKAEPWPWIPYGWSGDTERPNAVALVPGSFLARKYPVIAEGLRLPTLTRSDLLAADGKPSHYLFPTEQLAKLAAQLDQTLARQAGLTARQENDRWLLTDGKHTFRVYHYRRGDDGSEVALTARFAAERIAPIPCEQGPAYWRYIPAWEESAPAEPPPAPPQDAPATVASSPSPTRRTSAMILSIDIGYGYTKGVGYNGLHFSFPSVIGTAEDIRFATDLIKGSTSHAIQYGGHRFFYGDQALLQSRIRSAIFDRSRIHDDTYKMLFVAALVEMAQAIPDARQVNVVTGLPVEFFGDRAEVVESLEGSYHITAGREIELTVTSVFVAPQPFGSLFRELLNEQGKIVNSDIEQGRVGVIDIGTYTTDFVVADELRYVQRLSGSIRIGWSKVLSQVQQALSDRYRLELLPHEVDKVVQAQAVRVRGKPVSVAEIIAPAVAEVQTAVIARARDLWGEAADLDLVLVSGGGGPHLFDAIHAVYPHARLLDNAFWANAEGLYRFGQRPATFGG